MDYVLGIIAVIGIVILCVNTLLVILSMGAGLLSIALRIIQMILILSLGLYAKVTSKDVPDDWLDRIKNIHPTQWIK